MSMKSNGIRKFLAWALCLIMLVSMMALPVLATDDEGGDAPAAPAVEAPVERAEAPAKEGAPAEKAEVPAKDEAPAEKTETSPKEEAPAEKAETPAKDEAPAEKEETPAEKEETPAEKEEVPAEKEETPADKPVDEDEPADGPDSDEDEPATETRRPIISLPIALADDDKDEEDNSIATISALDDGFEVDWDSVGTLAGGDWQVSRWGLARGEGGYYVYLENTQPQISIGITYYTNSSDAIRYRSWIAGGASLLNESEQPITGSSLTVIASGNNYRMEGFIPDSFFKETSFILSSGNVTLKSENIPLLPGATAPDGSDNGDTDETPDEAEPAPGPSEGYTGIVIDGNFDDWASVPWYDIEDRDINGYPKSWSTVEHFAIVWDGDWIYILLVADGQDQGWAVTGNWDSVTGAGTHNNGQFVITTDLNRELLIQPTVVNGEPAVAGVDGAKAAVNNKDWANAPHMWELAIPASALGEYLESISFGFYMSEPAITGIMDLQGGTGVHPFEGNVVIDGKYEDWVGYPHYLIEYDGQGIQHHDVDAEGALWSNGGTLFGHVVTGHPDHVDEQGGEFLAAISIAFNGDRSYKDTPDKGNFYPRVVAIGADGSIATVNEGYKLPEGEYTFYIFDVRTDPLYQFRHEDGTPPTAAELIENAFGFMKVTVTDKKNEMEFCLDLEKVADYIGADADDFKVIEAQFGRIGQQWITTAGTSTGPMLMAALATGAVAVPMGAAELRRRWAKKKDEDQSEEQ